MANILKHADDDADLSLIVSGDRLFVACGNNHVWLVSLEIAPVPSTAESLRDALASSPGTLNLLETQGFL